ncbi:helix-turn-helix transcriptional regulator [Psychrobacillus sp. L4]|uniref:helix-turn-helix transcriptional regulator n=1 Tax=Psychrobacillus sp. L4 TaxID=3236892 RepID=UPI0036F26985
MTYYLQDYARFTNIADMDVAAEKHLSLHWNSMTNSDRRVLDVIRRYSVKYGAAHLKHATIENAIGISNATVRRAIRKLEKLGIIKKVHFIRPVMSGLGANIYIILPFHDQGQMNDRDEDYKPQDTKENEPISENEPFLYKSINKDLIKTSPQESFQYSTSLFSRMKNLLIGTIGKTNLAREFYGIYRSISGKMLRFDIYKDDKPVFEDLAYRALRITLMTTKRKVIRNLPGYFKGVLDKLVDETYFEDMFMYFDTPVEEFYCPTGQY